MLRILDLKKKTKLIIFEIFRVLDFHVKYILLDKNMMRGGWIHAVIQSLNYRSNFMRNDIGKKLCHFFIVDQSSLLTLILHEIARIVFLLSKLKSLIYYFMKNRHRVSKKMVKDHYFWPILLFHNFNGYFVLNVRH